MKSKNCKVLAVTSGKGGVGKSNFCINLSIALSKAGYETYLFDADLALGNADILFGELPDKTIENLIDEDVTLEDILLRKREYPNFSIIPAGKGTSRLANLKKKDKDKIIKEISKLKNKADFLIIDTAAGISDEVTSFIKLADRVVLIIVPEVTSIKDAYGMLKTLNEKSIDKKIDILINRAKSKTQVNNVFNRFQETVHKYLNIKVNLLGPMPEDEGFTESVNRQIPIVRLYPNSQISKFFKYYAEVLSKNIEPRLSIDLFFDKFFSNNNDIVKKNVSQEDAKTVFDDDIPYFFAQIEKSMGKMLEEINQLYKTAKLYLRKTSSKFISSSTFKHFIVGGELVLVENSNRFYTTKIVGWKIGQYIIIETRREIENLFIHNDIVTTRYLYHDKMMEFKTSLIKGFEPNSSLITISYPKDYIEYSLRGSERVSITLPSFVNYKNIKMVSGKMLDLSTNGGLLESTYPLDINDNLEISFTLPNNKKVENIHAKVKNIRDKNRYGLEFQNIPKLFSKRITDFISLYKTVLGESETFANEKFFSGNIENINLNDLLQFLCSLRKDLTIEILTESESGTIAINEGKVINANFGQSNSYEAFYKIINLKEGEFFINEGIADTKKAMDESLEILLLNNAYYIDTNPLKDHNEN